MTEDERLCHIGELKECLASVLSILDPPPLVTLEGLTPAAALRRQADEIESRDRLIRRARDLIVMDVR